MVSTLVNIPKADIDHAGELDKDRSAVEGMTLTGLKLLG